ncbi:MAG: phosphopantothenoylcysteine decarboxylase [Christensenellales bacterium]
MQEQSNRKIKVDGQPMVWQLKQTQDILKAIQKRQVVVGFAAETNDVQSYAMDKLQRKRLNMIVITMLRKRAPGLVRILILSPLSMRMGRICPHDIAPKEEIADFILDQQSRI